MEDLHRVKVTQARYAKCNCGSGKKYKNCCLRKGASYETESGVGPLIMEASLRGLDANRRDRDEAETTLSRLKHNLRSTPDDVLNISLALIGIAQRRGDHHGALEQLDALVIDEASEGKLHALNLRAVSLSQLGRHGEAAAIFDILLGPDTRKTSISGLWQMEAGRTYSLGGRTSDAIDATKKALSFFETANDAEHVARAKSNLAIFMLDSEAEDEVAEAEAALENACDIKIGLGDAEGASTNFSQLSMHHFARNRFEKAIAYGRKDLKLHGSSGMML
jgi:tetratricopeptide (TPR) repeat protein